jgi:hypothetical protein
MAANGGKALELQNFRDILNAYRVAAISGECDEETYPAICDRHDRILWLRANHNGDYL